MDLLQGSRLLDIDFCGTVGYVGDQDSAMPTYSATRIDAKHCNCTQNVFNNESITG